MTEPMSGREAAALLLAGDMPQPASLSNKGEKSVEYQNLAVFLTVLLQKCAKTLVLQRRAAAIFLFNVLHRRLYSFHNHVLRFACRRWRVVTALCGSFQPYDRDLPLPAGVNYLKSDVFPCSPDTNLQLDHDVTPPVAHACQSELASEAVNAFNRITESDSGSPAWKDVAFYELEHFLSRKSFSKVELKNMLVPLTAKDRFKQSLKNSSTIKADNRMKKDASFHSVENEYGVIDANIIAVEDSAQPPNVYSQAVGKFDTATPPAPTVQCLLRDSDLHSPRTHDYSATRYSYAYEFDINSSNEGFSKEANGNTNPANVCKQSSALSSTGLKNESELVTYWHVETPSENLEGCGESPDDVSDVREDSSSTQLLHEKENELNSHFLKRGMERLCSRGMKCSSPVFEDSKTCPRVPAINPSMVLEGCLRSGWSTSDHKYQTQGRQITSQSLQELAASIMRKDYQVLRQP